MRGCSDLRSACGAPPVKSRGEGLVPEQYPEPDRESDRDTGF
jgi:hypothetical protein